MAGGALVAPTLPAIMSAFSISKQNIGWVMGVYTLSTAISMPFVGVLSDRYGRKTILVPALFINGLAGLGTAFSGRFELILLFRFIQGIGIAGMMPIAMTLIGDLFDGKERVRAMGVLSATTGVGSAAAPFLGGMLAGITWRIPFFLYLLTIPLAVLVLLVIPIQKNKEVRNIKDYIRSFLAVPHRKRIIGILLLSFLSFVLLYALIIYIPILLTSKQFGLSEFWAGLFLAIQGITSGTAATQAKRLSERLTRPIILTGGFLLISGGLTVIFLSSVIWHVIAGLLIFGSGFGTVQPQLNTWVTEQVSHEQRGGLVSVFNMLKYVGQTTAPLLYGFLLAVAHLDYIFLVAAGIGIWAASIAFYLKRFSSPDPR
jgi:MFS family permease